jgi:alginate O-acetyltransferase complex protein AlgI
MLFNSEIFIFLFLPLTLFGFYGLSYLSAKRCAVAWLVFMSCVFYGWFRLDYLLLLLVLIVINYKFGILLSTQHKKGRHSPALLLCGLLINIGVLFYYKYSLFAVSNINKVLGTHYVLQNIILPIGISFFIFQKIAYLVDAYRGEAEEYNFLDFCLFVMYFPQLIAGPIVHHKELIPQFRQPSIFKFNSTDMSVGLTMFTIGLCKKILFADQLALWVDAPFKAIQSGWPLTFIESWVAALSFTLQIYFDFSAYTDMALGLALMMGIRLPQNFDSPYKATNIIDFWRRWHMSLSRFLRDYIYIPLGGNRKGQPRRYINLLMTMLIGGIWHGAAWTFLFWGALHGFYLIINHFWQFLKVTFSFGLSPAGWFRHRSAQLLTFGAVLVAWIFFRAENFKAAIIMLKGMIGFNGFALAAKYETTLGSVGQLLKRLGLHFEDSGVAYFHGFNQGFFILVLCCVVWLLPNTQQLCLAFKPVIQSINPVRIKRWWRALPFISIQNNHLQLIFSPVLAAILSPALLGAVFWQTLRATPVVNFIYFQF